MTDEAASPDNRFTPARDYTLGGSNTRGEPADPEPTRLHISRRHLRLAPPSVRFLEHLSGPLGETPLAS